MLAVTVLSLALSIVLLSACSQEGGKESMASSSATGDNLSTKIIELRTALQKSPDDAKLFEQLGQTELRAAEFASAEKNLRRAIDKGMSLDANLPALTDALIGQGEFGRLVSEFKVFIDDSKSNTHVKAIALAASGTAQLRLSLFNDAKQSFEQALKLDPANAMAKAGLAGVSLSKDDLAAARTLLAPLIVDGSQSADAYIINAVLLSREGKLSDARIELGKAIAIKPYDQQVLSSRLLMTIELGDYKTAKAELAQMRKSGANSVANAYASALLNFREGEPVQAREQILAVLKDAPRYLPAIKLAGQIALRNDELLQAERYSKSLIEQNPKLDDGYVLLVQTYLKMGMPSRAIQSVPAAMAQKTANVFLLADLAQAKLAVNDPTGAKLLLDQAAKLAPASDAIQTLGATSKIDAGDFTGGIRQLEAAAAADPSSVLSNIALTQIFIDAKQYDKAANYIKAIEKKQPKNAAAQYFNGIIAVRKGAANDAVKCFESALLLDPKHQPTLTAYAELDMSQGKFELAKARFENALKDDPKNIDYLILLANISRSSGADPAAVLSYYSRAKAVAPNLPAVAKAQAQYLMSIDRLPQALEVIETAKRTSPNDQSLLILNARALAANADAAGGIRIANQLIAADPSSAFNYQLLGDMRSKLSDYAGALKDYQKAGELSPQSVSIQYAIANALIKLGKKSDAESIAAKIQNDFPKSAEGWFLAGDIAATTKSYSAAALAYKTALGKQQRPDYVVKLYRALFEQKKFDDATTELRNWWAKNPADLSVANAIAEINAEAGRLPEAAALYKEVLEKKPDDVAALNNAAATLHRLKKPEALGLAQRALQIAPGAPAVLDTVGVITRDLGDHKKGMEYFRSALTIAPNMTEARFHLAQSLVSIGDKEGARKELAEVIRQKEITDPGILKQAVELNGSLGG